MVEAIHAVRGMNDILPTQTGAWRQLETAFSDCLSQYGYREIRFPLIEKTQLFKRSIGEITDIVEKEMYTFTDLNGDSLTLRPEGTAVCLRACLQHNLLREQQQKLWYSGPMFRHERPQQGRYRQFHQFGVEALGIEGAAIELELIAICQRLWRILRIDEHVNLQINNLGSLNERNNYKDQLVAYFKEHFEQLDEQSKHRLQHNPLRILDSKNPGVQELLQHAPKLFDFLSKENKQSFTALCEGLEKMAIPYEINPYLVRGLDYYGHTVFEWITGKLGSQAAVCAGGRYDKLVEQLGGKPTPAVGFALGIERLLLLTEGSGGLQEVEVPEIYIIASEGKAAEHAVLLAELLRNTNPQWSIITSTAGGSFKSQFKKADKSGARLALVLGEAELDEESVGIKDLRKTEQQITLPKAALIAYLQDYFSR